MTTWAEVLTQLESLVDAREDPCITDVELVSILGRAARADSAGNSPGNTILAGAWAALTFFGAGAVVSVAGRYWRARVAGTTGSTAPSWPALTVAVTSTEVVDGGVTWVDNGVSWTPTYDLTAAAIDGWTVKAGKAAGRFDFATDGQSFERSQVIVNCRRMADEYRRRRGPRSLVVVTE